MVGMVLTVYDGALSLIVQPVMGLLVGGVCVATALRAGLALRVPWLARRWMVTSWWALVLARPASTSSSSATLSD